MSTSKKDYQKMAKSAVPPSPVFKNCVWAFCVGGLICTLGEGLYIFLAKRGFSEEICKSAVSISLIILTAILTGLGVFDNIAKHAGAGTMVPITGFANSVVSPAMEFHSEGLVMGTGANMFKIAGPVIVYGSTACVVYGIIYLIVKAF